LIPTLIVMEPSRMLDRNPMLSIRLRWAAPKIRPTGI
jgi:hypothetical protein